MLHKPTNSNTPGNKSAPAPEFYTRVINSLEDYAIFTLDKELKITSWSAAAAKIFGYSTEEISGKHFDIIFTEADKKKGIPQIEIDQAMQKGEAMDNRWHVCKDKSTFYSNGLTFPLTGTDGKISGYVKILRDLTERKKSEDSIKKYLKELDELNSYKERVLGILSHDLRSPLAIIISTARFLQAHFDSMEKSSIEQMLGLLHASSKEQLSMLDQLVEWARLKYASESFAPATIDLGLYVQHVFEMLREISFLNTIQVHSAIAANTFVFADGKMLLSIIQNIISNAIKHTLPGGHIRVFADKKDDNIVVQIQDNGTGMSKEEQERLFIPQAGPLLKAREGSKAVGIGLLLVKGFIEKNGGEIWVESTEGEGSSFYFTLPANPPAVKFYSAK